MGTVQHYEFTANRKLHAFTCKPLGSNLPNISGGLWACTPMRATKEDDAVNGVSLKEITKGISGNGFYLVYV